MVELHEHVVNKWIRGALSPLSLHTVDIYRREEEGQGAGA